MDAQIASRLHFGHSTYAQKAFLKQTTGGDGPHLILLKGTSADQTICYMFHLES
jgi:hypothetical protein